MARTISSTQFLDRILRVYQPIKNIPKGTSSIRFSKMCIMYLRSFISMYIHTYTPLIHVPRHVDYATSSFILSKIMRMRWEDEQTSTTKKSCKKLMRCTKCSKNFENVISILVGVVRPCLKSDWILIQFW